MNFPTIGCICVLMLFSLSSCSTWDPDNDLALDPVTKMTKKQIAENLSRTPPSIKKKTRPFIKKSDVPVIPAVLKNPVTLSTTESVPLKDVFFQIARQANVDLSIDPNVKGGVALHATHRPLIDIVRELCTLNRLRYKIENNILRIEPDKPYLLNYNAQFLSLTRQNQSRISVATDIFTTNEGQGSTADNGSNTLLTGETKNDFWAELESNLSTILQNSDAKEVGQDKSSYSLHKQAGIISVYGTQAQHQQVEHFLKLLRLSTSSQVLIEAKIVEVILKDEFKAGINWNLLKGDLVLQSPLGDTITPGSFNKNATPVRDVFTFGGSGKQLTEIVGLINKFGTVRTLSSPRLTAMNNEPGVIKVATNYVYFRINYNRDYGYDSVREHEYVSSEIHTVPIGLIMVVHPSINLADGSIVLSLRPTISRVVDEKADPAVAIVSKEAQQSYVPVVRKQEFESLVCMNSGEFIVMGGLMEEVAKNNQSGVPYLSEVPLLGNLAKAKSEDRVVSELVIFLKATIVDNKADTFVPVTESTVAPADTHLYENFALDPRPL
ncbi:type II secretion system protein D precursor [Caedimonas varicaedens]|jgi:MSHA type pilus biogenesis protein MshL|uniref:Type II secretion system protein D n=1 Tax=Caedimonas varicaedens TaxID=1629334 RepID=A0A0K8MF58_9PROT|nr:type II secretion system protein D precursor [Caedimonas varicaedens]